MRSPLALFAFALTLGVASAQPQGRPYYDPKRSLEKQREAAKEAGAEPPEPAPRSKPAPSLHLSFNTYVDNLFKAVKNSDKRYEPLRLAGRGWGVVSTARGAATRCRFLGPRLHRDRHQ